MRDLNEQQISDCVDRRFKLEQNLALDLLAEFDNESNGLIGPLRQMAGKALEDLLSENIPIQDFATALESLAARRGGVWSAMGDEKLLSIWQQNGWQGGIANRHKPNIALQQLQGKAQHLTASQCSDIIRLYGAVAEKWGAAPGLTGGQLDTLKERYRPGGKMVWGAHARVRAKPAQGAIPGEHKQWQMPAAVHGIDFKQAGKGQVKEMLPDQRRSINVTVFSTVKKVDNAFGLPLGADISGTTADSMFFVERFARRCRIKYDPIYQLLALATLVAARHHALLEVALTMTLNKIITYSIGFYSTLLPPGSTHTARAAIDGVFKEHERHDWNEHILAYFDQHHRRVGGYLFEGGEIDRFKKLATTGPDFMWLFTTMPPFPTKGRIRMMMGSKGLL